MRRTVRWTAARLAVLLALAGCAAEPEPDPVPPTARPAVARMLIEDVAAVRHPADGGGRAWLAAGDPPVAGRRGSWEIAYEAGAHGVAVGGWVMLQVSPFWGWSTPQTERPRASGFTVVETEADGVELVPRTLGEQLLGVEIGGRPLAQGEIVRFRYGAGEAGAVADRYAEGRSFFWVAVDGDGDGVRGLVPEPPSTPVTAGPPARLVATIPSTARPGERVRLAVAALDVAGNAGTGAGLAVTLEGSLVGATRQLTLDDRGTAALELAVPAEGTHRLTASAPGGLAAETPPLLAGDGPRLLWGDLHGHSDLSDGTGTPDDYFRYARDVAALDVVSLTDHDHWGLRTLAASPDLWAEIVAAVDRFHDPGRFVTLDGFEWTNWIHGHRHVLWFDGEAEVYDSLDPDYDTPAELWAALAGRDALTFAHHSAGGPIAVDWSYRPPPEIEPVTEITSVHGSSEALDSPGVIYSAVPGNFVRDVLDTGVRLGFVGSGDSHDGHPGLAHLVSGQGGLAGIWAEAATREAVLEALRGRRVYATNGPRIYLRTELAGHPMGSTLGASEASVGPLRARVVAVQPIERIELVVAGAIEGALSGDGRRELELEIPLDPLAPGDYLYLRVVQEDGGTAWSSPYFAE